MFKIFKRTKKYGFNQVADMTSEAFFAGATSLMELLEAVKVRVEGELRVKHRHLLDRYLEDVRIIFAQTMSKDTIKKAITKMLKNEKSLAPIIEELNGKDN